MRTLLPALVLFVCAGCQTLAPEADRRARDPAAVMVPDPGAGDAVTDNCTKGADLSVRPPFPLLARRYPALSSFGRAEVEAGMRSRAVRVGANTVLPTGLVDGRTHADAYDCAERD